MSARDMIISSMLIGLFAFSLMSFGIGIAVLNDGTSIGDSPALGDSFSEYEAQLNSTQATAEGQRDNFDSEAPTIGFGEILFATIVGVGRTFTSTIVTFTDITFGLLWNSVFGGSKTFAVVFGVIMSIIIVSIIFLFWRVYKAGE